MNVGRKNRKRDPSGSLSCAQPVRPPPPMGAQAAGGWTTLAAAAVLDEVVEIERAQRLGDLAFPGVDRVGEQHRDLGDVPPGLDRASLRSLGRRDGAQKLPQKLHVDVVQRPPYGEVVQLTGGKCVQFIAGGHAWTLPPALRRDAPPGQNIDGQLPEPGEVLTSRLSVDDFV